MHLDWIEREGNKIADILAKAAAFDSVGTRSSKSNLQSKFSIEFNLNKVARGLK
jgi:hypothetical protein